MRRASDPAVPAEWVSLKEASARAGVSVSWLRKQYRQNGLPTRETVGPRGAQKAVPIQEVLRRAAVFATGPDGAPAPASAPAVSAADPPAPTGTTVADLTAALFERFIEAEGRAARAEAEVAYLVLCLDDAYREVEDLRDRLADGALRASP